jgi:hypothetical protein
MATAAGYRTGRTGAEFRAAALEQVKARYEDFGPTLACERLAIEIIAASSPQAKGRVERAHGTHQDRLVKKLRLAGIANYDQANAFVEEHHLAAHNRRCAHQAAAPADYHRRRPTTRQLDEGFWLEEERVLSEDWVVRYNNRL